MTENDNIRRAESSACISSDESSSSISCSCSTSTSPYNEMSEAVTVEDSRVLLVNRHSTDDDEQFCMHIGEDNNGSHGTEAANTKLQESHISLTYPNRPDDKRSLI